MLSGKVAVVTGGGGGIGKAISLAFAANGAKVVVAECEATRAQATVAEIEAAGGKAMAAVVDVRDREQALSMAKMAREAWGQIDVLVNNAGSDLGLAKNFVDTDEDEWEALRSINFKQVLYCTKAVVPEMIERGTGGSVINISSIEAHRGMPQGAVHSAFKSALADFSRSLAVDLARHKIRMNEIAVDVTRTTSKYQEVAADDPMIPVWVPAGRFGLPDDIAEVALFLASDRSRFVIGATIHADGGTFAAGGWYPNVYGQWVNWPDEV